MAKFFTVRAGNAKKGTTKKGDPWISIGLVVKDGPQTGTWYNYFKTVTEKSAPYVEKDLAVMGITDPDPMNFQCDGRLFTAVWDYDEFFKEERVVRVIPSKFKPDVARGDQPRDMQEPF